MSSRGDKLDEQTVALRVAREFEDGMVVNLGGGLPSLAANFIPEGREILFESENGVLGFGPIASTEEADWDLVNAGFQPITRRPGMSFFSNDERPRLSIAFTTSPKTSCLLGPGGGIFGRGGACGSAG